MIVRSLSALTLLALSAVSGSGQEVLDIIPSEATAAAAVRNLKELRVKGDKFVADLQVEAGLRPSQLFDMLFQALGISGFDETAPNAVIFLRPEKGDKDIFRSFEKNIYASFAVGDKDMLARSFGLEANDLVAKTVIATKRDNNMVGVKLKAVCLDGKNLLVGLDKAPLERTLKLKPLATTLPAAQRKLFNEADLFLFLDPRPLGDIFGGGGFEKSAKELLPPTDDPHEKKLLQLFMDSMPHIRHGIAGFRVGDGLGVNFSAVFDSEAQPPREILKMLREGAKPAHLGGLPEGRLVVAHAQGSDGRNSGVIAKVMFSALLNLLPESKQMIATADRPVFAGVIAEIWHQLRGNRFGVYLSGDESKQGLFSMVAILDTDDPGKFVQELRTLAKIGDGSALDLDKKQSGDAPDIAKLVRDLGDAKYQVRQSATLRLRLIGEPALSHLDKAAAEGDLETTRRAQQLYKQISEVAAQRRKELLNKDLPRGLRPTFGFIAKAETRGQLPIDVIHIRLAERDRPFAKQLEQLLGPEWDRLRLAIYGNQVVVLVGSDTALLEKALANVTAGKPGLAKAPALADFAKSAGTDHLVQFHASLESLMWLTAPEKIADFRPAGRLTSLGLRVAEDRIDLDAWSPMSELKMAAKGGRLLP
jgi:hypothetical protein